MKRIWCLACLFLLTACATRQPDHISVNLTADGQTRAIVTDAKTVGTFLKQAGVSLGELDRVRPGETTSLQEDQTITVIRVTQATETLTETIPFRTTTLPDASLPPGPPISIQPGHNGERVLTYRLTYEDGVEVKREQIADEVTLPPQDEIRRVGIKDVFATTPFEGTIAFISNNNAFVMRDTPSGRRAVTSAGDLDGLVFDLSPDGRWLIYTRALTDTLNELWIADTALATPEARSLGVVGVLWAAWSPDGASIAYSTAEPSAGPARWRAHNDLFVLPINAGRAGRTDQILPERNSATYAWWGSSYAWSPNNDAIAIADTDGLSLVDLTTPISEPVRLATYAPFNTRSTWAWTPTPTWSPDGQFIAFTSHGKSETGRPDEDSERFDVYAVSRDGLTLVRLFNPAGMWSEPNWSIAAGDNSTVALGQPDQPYESNPSPYTLLLLDRDGSNRRRVFPPQSEQSTAPALGLEGRPDLDWSPDGTQLIITYRTRPTAADVYQGDLYVIDVTSGTVRQLTTDGTLRSPRWSR